MASSSNTPALEERPETPEGPLMKRKEDKAAWKKTVAKRKRKRDSDNALNCLKPVQRMRVNLMIKIIMYASINIVIL